jgi:hypothetical protein
LEAAVTNRDNFRTWFAAQFRKLSDDHDAGFIMAMAAFPLLERYLRQSTKSEPKSPRFIAGLLKVFPELASIGAAQTFWTTYRHGLLHNVTMSRESHGLTHESAAVQIDANHKVWLNPVLFAERVVALIEADFHTFESGEPLPTVNVYGRVPEHSGAPNYYLGTGMPPRQGDK